MERYAIAIYVFLAAMVIAKVKFEKYLKNKRNGRK